MTSKCQVSVLACESGGSPFDIRAVECERPTVPCPKCGGDSGLCQRNLGDNTCDECELAAVTA